MHTKEEQANLSSSSCFSFDPVLGCGVCKKILVRWGEWVISRENLFQLNHHVTTGLKCSVLRKKIHRRMVGTVSEGFPSALWGCAVCGWRSGSRSAWSERALPASVVILPSCRTSRFAVRMSMLTSERFPQAGNSVSQLETTEIWEETNRKRKTKENQSVNRSVTRGYCVYSHRKMQDLTRIR